MPWTLVELARNPPELHKLREALNSGKREAGEKQLQNVLKESMRLNAVLPNFSYRQTGKKYTSGTKEGYVIPKVAEVHTPYALVFRHPDLYEEPDRFQPDRWNKKDMSRVLIPFGLGPRNCIGQRLARVVMASVVGKLTKEYDLALEEEPTPEY